MKSDGLFSELRIKNITFKNRLGVAPMTRTSSSQDGIPRQDVLDFWFCGQKMALRLFIPGDRDRLLKAPRAIPANHA